MSRIVCGWFFTLVLMAGLAACTSPGSSMTVAERELLENIVAARPVADRARDAYRNPVDTLEFCELSRGMTVVEVLPGGGWYSRIVAPYLGASGTLHAVNYADRMWSMFGFMNEEFVAARKAQMRNWPEIVTGYGGNGAMAQGFAFEAIGGALERQVDRVLMIRALHNLNRFEAQAGTRSAALADVQRMLKPGGLVCIVQHRAPESASDAWAQGQNGYLKEAAVIAMMEAAGFELLARSEINRNPADKPGEGDNVWRLPPSYRGTSEDPALRAAVDSIGESDRMTLKFIKR